MSEPIAFEQKDERTFCLICAELAVMDTSPENAKPIFKNRPDTCKTYCYDCGNPIPQTKEPE